MTREDGGMNEGWTTIEITGDTVKCECGAKFPDTIPIVDGGVDVDRWELGQHLSGCGKGMAG